MPVPRRLARRLSDDVIAELVARYEAGATSPELCAQFGLAKGSVLRILDRHGVLRKRGGLSPSQTTRAVELYAGGLSIQRIANQLGSNYSTVRAALVKSGVTMRGRLDYQSR
jgi:DNA-directed RNA polymerase specialized sigma24 family protein